MKSEIVLVGGRRTPFGDFGRSLRDVPLVDQGAHAAAACLRAAGVAPSEVDHLVWANAAPVDQEGYFASRVIGQRVGLAVESAALNVSRACGSGTQAVITAAEQILSGHGQVALAGGGESFSRMPFVLTTGRWGHKRGPQTLVDTLDYAYRCPFSGELMGETAENLAAQFEYRREAMDEIALTSQERAAEAIRSGFLARQIEPIDVLDGKGTRRFAMDEYPRTTSREKLAALPPAFRAGGTVTAGNSSGVTDGAAFVIVADRAAAARLGLTVRARLVDWAIVGVPPRIMGSGPVPAIRRLLERQHLVAADIDYWEINEAFAVVNLHAETQIGIPRDKTNLYGGGISIGHPPGATGVRMLMTAMQHLEERGGRLAIASMCLGAGQGMAVLIERA
jgi:acetyl-CoA acetyltransferase family protein